MGQRSKEIRRRGIYLLPNLLTLTALFCGFFAIVAATKGWFDWAAYAIFIAMILDGADGRVARWTNTQSDFGAEFDSLSDMVSFGVAPALIIFEYALGSTSQLGKIGWVAAFIYTAAAALRLARFNTQVGTADKAYFQGLPSPAAAGIVTGFVWVSHIYLDPHPVLNIFAVILTISAGVLMVSNIRYHSFKGFDFRSKVPFVGMVAIVMVIAVVVSDPPIVLFSIFLLYAGSGPVLTLYELQKRRKQRRGEEKKTESVS
ncbi:CDP-diacylglycerol--serine O-phosphatidyltransferase [hydrothermal vent metagenome]|uniref:CDP-diacylglycerol--serine O-phosphatidyltransferase n=1 Tax=hydrothermal vent metagenome TaxID=652676 RepID=A0A3B0ZI51_9ZZZZ